ncbi:MAG TPA: LytTR family DNA-binding domain-containing protein [Puia sp.]|nr:LytTR family DNA-binding domain-containing protein [Puia sp.]
MIRTILVDDEADSKKVLQRLLDAYCPEVAVIGQAEGVDTAFELIRTANPDLVFLDIEMIHGNAFDLLNRLQPFSFQVIFVTAFDNYAVRAFKFSAVDYLLKPVDADELRNAVAKVVCRSQGTIEVAQLRTLLENVGNLHLSNQKMAVPTMTGLTFVPISDILRFEASGHYTAIRLDDGQAVISTRNIKEYEDLLPDTFFYRVHHSYIVNIHKIREYQKGRGGYVIMNDGFSVEVAIRRREDFLRRLIK